MTRTLSMLSVTLLLILSPKTASADDAYASVDAESPPGWALGGAVLGFATIPVVGLLTVGSAATTGRVMPALPLGAAAAMTFGVTVPLVMAASSSVRSQAGVPGLPGLRVATWVIYGIGIGLAGVAVALGMTTAIPAPIILGLGAAGIATTLMACIEALVARAQAKQLVMRASAPGRDRVRVSPYLALAPDASSRGTATMLGLTGSF